MPYRVSKGASVIPAGYERCGKRANANTQRQFHLFPGKKGDLGGSVPGSTREMQWHSENKDGEWHWASEALPNGWSAFVSDYSQLDEAYDQPTVYTVGARSCKGRKIELRETEREFNEAKRIALRLAMEQENEKK